MTQKPLITIDKFSGMGQNGIIFCEGFYPEVDNGKSVMSEGYYQAVNFQDSTTGFANLQTVYGAISLVTVADSSAAYSLYIDNGIFQRIYSREVVGFGNVEDGEIHVHSSSNRASKPDIIETNEGNILYPSRDYIGRGLRGKATGGSTTTIVDTTKDFVTLGYVNGDKVTNLKTGIEYTITGVATNTLTFSASGSNTTAANDEYIAWDDNKYDTIVTRQVWQPAVTNWVKQFKIYGDQYMFTNGNYLGMISTDESTVDKTYKQLPAKHQAVCFDVNNDQILVSADYNGKGVLLLWDGASSGWSNFIETDAPIIALVAYKSGWLYVSKGTVFYTDGYQIQKIYFINSTRPGSTSTDVLEPASHNGLTVYGNRLFIANINSDLNLVDRGVYVFNLDNPNDGFSLIRMEKSGRANAYPYSVFVSNIFSGGQSLQAGCLNAVNYIYYGNSNTTYFDKSMVIMINLPEPRRITGVGLNLSRYLKQLQDDGETLTREVQVSIGDASRGFKSYAQGTVVTTTTMTVNGTNYKNNQIGDEIFVYDNDAGFGERAFVTNIVDPGTTTEDWTFSPAFSSVFAGTTDLYMLRLKKLDRQTISWDKLNEEKLFLNNDTGILSNKIFIEIVFFGKATNPLPLNINEIKVYGD